MCELYLVARYIFSYICFLFGIFSPLFNLFIIFKVSFYCSGMSFDVWRCKYDVDYFVLLSLQITTNYEKSKGIKSLTEKWPMIVFHICTGFGINWLIIRSAETAKAAGQDDRKQLTASSSSTLRAMKTA